MSYISHRQAEANNKYMDNYNPKKESSYIMYLDANYLYAVAMIQPLPTRKFKWAKSRYTLDNYSNGTGAVVELNLKYLHDLQGTA